MATTRPPVAAPPDAPRLDGDANSKRAVEPSDQPFPINGRVQHPTLGQGTVVGYEGERWRRVWVAFDGAGKRRLSLDVVRKRGLLQPVQGSGARGQ